MYYTPYGFWLYDPQIVRRLWKTVEKEVLLVDRTVSSRSEQGG